MLTLSKCVDDKSEMDEWEEDDIQRPLQNPILKNFSSIRTVD